jgi:putative two-component system response regulator
MNEKIILVVDDDLSFIKLLTDFLRDLGRVDAVTSIADAEKYLSSAIPDIILLDNHLGDGMGIKLLEKLKNKQITSKIPMILITASSDPANEEEALLVGANDFIQKPINLKIAFLRIRNAMKY